MSEESDARARDGLTMRWRRGRRGRYGCDARAASHPAAVRRAVPQNLNDRPFHGRAQGPLLRTVAQPSAREGQLLWSMLSKDKRATWERGAAAEAQGSRRGPSNRTVSAVAVATAAASVLPSGVSR